MQIDYSTLGQQVAEWQTGYIKHVRNTYGEEHAADTERRLREDPWEALRWFVEDMGK